MNDHDAVSHDLIGAYALGAVDDLERARFDRHLEECADCRAELAELNEATTALAATLAEAPPAHLRGEVLERITQTPQESHEAPHADRPAADRPGVEPARHRGTVGQRVGTRAKRLALVAAALVAVALFSLNALTPRQGPLDDVRAAALEGDTSEVNRLIEEFDDELAVDDVVTDTGVTARVVSSDDDTVLITDGLPELPGDQTYQAWLMEDEGPRPAGLLGPGADPVGGVGDLDEGVQAVAVSVEPAGGSEQPSDEIVLMIPTA
jgi:anti-sigma-K factor RskA